MTGIVPGSVYDRLIKKGLKEKEIEDWVMSLVLGREKGAYMKAVIGIRNMTLDKLEVAVIAKYLNEPIPFIKTIQKQLKKEKRIVTLTNKNKTVDAISEQLKVTAWLVEAIQGIREKQKK